MTPSLPDPALLLAWYDRHRRVLPWRGDDASRPDPYRVWLSEVMLQQTTVAAVGPRYTRFLARFPDVQALADAGWEEVAEEWAGLGYYARARNLHAGAKALAAEGFPRTVEGLRAIPGIGPYTASAVAAIAFGQPVVPADGNVERVVARLLREETPLPAAKPGLTALAQGFMSHATARARPSDFAQALFDLGATICTPRNPACALCPFRDGCAAQAAGIQAELPRKTPKRARPTRHGVHFLLFDDTGAILVRRRPPKGLLGGMLEIPGTPWRTTPWEAAEALAHAPLPGLAWQPLPGEARHGFTHFELRMTLLTARLPGPTEASGFAWMPPQAAHAAMPSAMHRLLELRAAG